MAYAPSLQLDDCWAATNRTADGNLQPDPTRFPSGIPALADYVHQRGLYLGLYTCAGPVTCKYNRTGRCVRTPRDHLCLAMLHKLHSFSTMWPYFDG